ncbi:small ribosomal subunit protein mS26 [Anabrus simplex]|uniref:small ribosomal subunit protein mS26 n=1 Tax=Anabrus simplex TaxID=316456 RepID=UPI0034DCE248
MLRQTSNIVRKVNILSPVDIVTVIESPTYYQGVRWRRKPRWVPVAKSKMFRVPERPKVPEEEMNELQRLNNNYNTQIKSIRAFLKEQVQASYMTVDTSLDKERLEAEDFARCMKINDEWNAKIVKIREERLAKQAELTKEKVIQKIIQEEEKEKQTLEEIERIVREEKEKAKSYITADNIDEAIEKALNTEVDYNFAIDLDGNIYHGRLTKPSDVTQQDEKLKVPAHSGS